MNAAIDYEKLARALIGQSTTVKTVSSTPNAVYAHGGKGGLFSAPGLSRPLFSAMEAGCAPPTKPIPCMAS